jgi:hypothetical protein
MIHWTIVTRRTQMLVTGTDGETQKCGSDDGNTGHR